MGPERIELSIKTQLTPEMAEKSKECRTALYHLHTHIGGHVNKEKHIKIRVKKERQHTDTTIMQNVLKQLGSKMSIDEFVQVMESRYGDAYKYGK